MTNSSTRCNRNVGLAPALRRLAACLLCSAGAALAAEVPPLPELDCLVEPFQVIDVGSARGIVKSVAVDRSDAVSARDVLVQLDDDEQQATVRQARARARMSGDLKSREAALAFAERKLARISELFASEAISSYQRDEVQTELEMARQDLRQAQEARDLARLDLERANVELAKRTIRSPVDGIVVERYVGPGEFVNDSPLVRVAQMNPLRVEAIAPASLYGQIRAGMQARVLAESQGDTPLLAEVTIVDRLIDPASGTFGIRLELPNPDYAVPSGLNCRLQIEPLAADYTPATDPEQPAIDPVGDQSLSATTTDASEAIAPHVAATVSGHAEAAQMTSRPPAVQRSGAAGRGNMRDAPQALPSPAPDLLTSIGAGLIATPSVAHSASACVTLGPIGDEQLWRKLQIALADEPVAVTPHKDGASEQVIGYFVVTARNGTMAQTRALRDELRAAGVADIAILTRPPYARRVSLGLYSSAAGARARKSQVDAGEFGIETEIVPRTSDAATYWLDLAASADVLDAQPWHRLAPDLEVIPCAGGRVVADAKSSVR